MSDLLQYWEVIRSYLAGIILLCGGVIVFIGASGVLRLPDFYTRLHAAGVTDTLGTLLVLLGLIILSGFTLLSAKLALVGLFLLLTSPAATHAVANAAHIAGLKPRLGTIKSETSQEQNGDKA
ncbi:MAG: hypothetical protein COA84_03415 [Robiginitomaculum sp.]|nr:MAG: hypothetical protein COA84_03415 [Robiginitomaculum sp.]